MTQDEARQGDGGTRPPPDWRARYAHWHDHQFEPMIAAHLRDLYAERHRAHAFSGDSPQAHRDWAAAARPVLRRLIGLDRMAGELADHCPTVTVGEAEELDGYSRAHCVLHAEPHFDVPFWYLKPLGGGPHPLALFPHGHSKRHGLDFVVDLAHTPEMQRRIQEEERDVAVQAVRRGYAAMAPANRGFHPTCVADLNSRHGGQDCRSHLFHSVLAGRTAVGERVWDLQHLMDWGAAQPDTDASRILMMGNSGGGVATLYTAACDERVGIAVASCSFCTYVGRSGLIHFCDCSAVPGIMRFGECYDVAGLIAPRPFLAVHGREDPLFPREEIERAVAAVRVRYTAAGAPDAFDHRYGPGGHRFYSDLMWSFIGQFTGCAARL